jgi:hypothetical protein
VKRLIAATVGVALVACGFGAGAAISKDNRIGLAASVTAHKGKA